MVVFLTAYIHKAKIPDIARQRRATAAIKPWIQSRHLVDRIDEESIWLRSLSFADAFAGREAAKCPEATCEVAGVHEVAKMDAQLVLSIVVMGFDGRVADHVEAHLPKRGCVSAPGCSATWMPCIRCRQCPPCR